MGGFQLWVNLPASLKMSQPRYQDLSAAQIPEVRRDDGTVIRVVAGEVDGVGGAVTEIYAEPEYLDVSLPAGRRTSSSRCRGGMRPSRTPSRARACSASPPTSATAATSTACCSRRRRWPSSATATWSGWRPAGRRCASCS